jgi:glutathione S-transferase
MIRLYRARWSTNSERVALALAHKGLDAESVWIEYSDRSEVKRVSGQGLVPVIDWDGTVVHDSPRILEYLEEREPDPPLYPADRARRAEMDTLIDWFNGVWKTWPNGIEAELGRPEPDEAKIDAHAAAMAASLDRFEALLSGRDHLFGDELSAADCIAYPFVKFAAFREPEDDELFHRILDDYQQLGAQHERLRSWIELVRGRPQV